MDIILHQIRNPGTGWWGERYVFGDRTEFVDDLSLTFHIVRYLDGNVPDHQRIIETALALKDLNEPAGWLDDGHFTDHNNMDVAVLSVLAGRRPTPRKDKLWRSNSKKCWTGASPIANEGWIFCTRRR